METDIPNKQSNFVQKLRAIVLENYTDEQFGVSDLVSAYGVSRSQLHRKLKAVTGQSISQFIREIRLDEALKLLQQNDLTASEVAYKVGFNSPTYFNTCFHEYFGYPPGEAKHHIGEPRLREAGISNGGLLKRSFLRRNKTAVLVVAVLISFSLVYLFYFKPLGDKEIVANKLLLKEKSIAVLPLKNWSGDLELEYISDGMTDAIITNLSKVTSIKRVVPFTSISGYKDSQKSVSEIAKELNVSILLQGSFQLSGEQVSINLQLIDGATEKQLWNNEYNGTWNTDEIFEMQSKVVENVINIMNVELTEAEEISIQRIPTPNKEAYNSYLLARHQVNKGNEIAFNNAIRLYERAIVLDSNFTDAYVGLAEIWIYGGLIWGIYDEHSAWDNAKLLLQKAVQLDSTNFRISDQLCRGYFYYDWDFKAVETYLINRKLNPYFDETKFTVFHDYELKVGRFNELLVLNNSQIEFNPLESWAYILKAWVLFYLNINDESFDVISSYSSLFIEDLDYLREAAKLYYYLGEYNKSKEQLTLILNNFTDRPPIIYWLSAVHAQIDENEAGVNTNLNKLLEQYDSKTSGSPSWFIALYYCHVKDYDKTFEWLQKSYERHEVEMLWLKEEPLLRGLRSDPRYIDLYDKVGFSKFWPISEFED